MGTLSIQELSKRMGDIDFCMLSTRAEGGRLASRPMSNNGDVAYDGDSWFFSYEDTPKVREIERDPKVGLTFTAGTSLLGKPGIFISIEGETTLVRDRSAFEAHWTKSLDRWFPQGADTPGIVLLKVRAKRVQYWDGEEQGEVEV